MTRTRSLMSAALLAGLALSLLPLSANALTPSFASPPYQRPTFGVGVAGLVIPQTGAMDAVCISGSATKTIRIKRIQISGTDATAQTVAVTVVKRSTVNSGGTSTAPTIGALDSTNAAATAAVKAYTVAPTPGTAVATLRAQSIALPAAATAVSPAVTWAFDPSDMSQEIVLRGVAESACLNFPAAFTTAGPTVNVDLTWSE